MSPGQCVCRGYCALLGH